MFPQSELDNYKLQVELLQEKLQRSEISRQHLEHKLDKILQKRDEHDKIVRSKARQKYQQFLEEQQRRNERNKQLVQMLERIEQQTEVMNARSERLKMMKLQYEMYFAKLVHTQTRRCIQNSVQPVTHFMPASSTQPVWSAVQQSTMEGHNYMTDTETTAPLGLNHSYKCFVTRQEENMPAMNTSDIPTLTNFVKTEERNNSTDPRDINMAPSTPPQHFYQYNTNTEAIKNIANKPAHFTYNNNNEIPKKNTSHSNVNAIMTNPSAAYLLSNDKKLPESRENSNLSTITTSSTFEEIPNSVMMSQKQVRVHTLSELAKPSRILNSKNNDVVINNYIPSLSTVDQPLNIPQNVKEKPLKSTNEKDSVIGHLKNANEVNKFNAKPQDARTEIQNPKTNEYTNNDIKLPNEDQKPSTSSQLETPNSVTETFLNSTKNKNLLQKQPVSFEQTENEFLLNNTATNSSATSVSIENIENEIYGELLSPLDREEVKSEETSNVVPKLLENLVTQSENIENISSGELQVKQEAADVKHNGEYNTVAAANSNEQNQISYNYEQNVTNDEFTNVQQSEEPAKNFDDYTNYESAGSAEIDENQQQYDYSNYDPTQYSYPGYVYDETTGEYKPDPNAPLEQYATNQQYSSEGYEQQYQQQDFDYNQTYTEEQETGLSTDAENTVNNDYNTNQEEASNVTTTDNNVAQQQMIPEQESISPQTVLEPEEVTTSTTPKIVKPTSILSSADKTESQKKKKRVNFIDSSETDESAGAADKGAAGTSKPVIATLAASSESDFDFSSSTEAEAKGT